MVADEGRNANQQIRFEPVTGGRLAVGVVGEGPALVLPAPWISHLELEWRFPEYRAFVQRLAEQFTVIRYDRLGVGLSDPDPNGLRPHLELEAHRLGELVDRLALDELRLFGVSWGGCVALAYAASGHATPLRSVVVHGCPIVGADLASEALRASIAATIRSHWGTGSRVLADIWVPGMSADVRERFTRLQRAAVGPEAAAAGLEAIYAVDLRPLLPAVDVPVLVTHRRQDRAAPFAAARELAAAIPGARLVPLDGAVHPPWLGDADAVLAAVLPFLGDGGRPDRGAERRSDTPLSPREREVLRLVADGLSDEEIAARLVVSPHTVHRHVANIRGKLGQPSRAAAVAYAIRLGLL